MCGIHFHTWSFSIFFAGLRATRLCHVNESPQRSSTSMDRTGRPITLWASHQLFWHTGWWDRTRLATPKARIMMEIVTHIMPCKLLKSSCSRGFSPRYSSHLLWQKHKTHKTGDRNAVTEQLFNSDSIPSALNLPEEIKLTFETTRRTFFVFLRGCKNTMHKSGKQRGEIGFLGGVRALGDSWCEWKKGGENDGWWRKVGGILCGGSL